jgi:hypothetical protein
VTRTVGADFREDDSVADETVYGRLAHIGQTQRQVAAQLGQTADLVLYLAQGATIGENQQVVVDADLVSTVGFAGTYDVVIIQHTRRGPQVILRRRTV